jgi:hypothetical protein
MAKELPVAVEKSKDGATIVRTDRGSIRAKCVREKLFFTFHGFVTVGMFEPSMVVADAALAGGLPLVLIGDGEAWDGYEPGYRNRWTSWFLAHKKQVRTVHLLSKSKMIHMGAQVVNLALGTPLLRMYGTRGDFERGVAGPDGDRPRPAAG